MVGTANVPSTPGVLLAANTFGPGAVGVPGTGTTGTVMLTGTGTATATGSNTSSRSPASSASSITGTVLDAATRQPIQGTVAVALEVPGANGFTIVAQTTTDVNGNFSFANVAAGPAYSVVISAVSGSNFFVPAIIAGAGPGVPSTATFQGGSAITPGTNIGTVGLTLPASGTTSMVINGVNLSSGFGGINEGVGGTTFVIPLATQVAGSTQITVPAFQAQLAAFNPNGMTFSPTVPVTVVTVP